MSHIVFSPGFVLIGSEECQIIYGIDTDKQRLFFIYGLQVHRGRTPPEGGHGGVTCLES